MKNKFMRAATLLMALTLMTSCFVGGTFAKYTTSATSQDTARVAHWGFNNAATINIENLFQTSYDQNVNGYADVIAPGTTNSKTFQFTYDQTNTAYPEVAYDFTVSVDDSYCDTAIASNPNIRWKLDANEWTDWGTFLNQIKGLSGSAYGTKQYTAGTLPEAFPAEDTVHTVAWKWEFSTSDALDAADTQMGNAADLADVLLKITITATQVD